MVEPTSDIKVGLRVWKYVGYARDAWRQVKQIGVAQKQIADLETRIAALEKRLERCPGEGCPHRGALEWRVETVKSDPRFSTIRVYTLKCKSCGFEDVVERDTSAGHLPGD